MTIQVKTIRLGTRASALARQQSRQVADLLTSGRPGLEVELVPVTTQGDRELTKPLPEIGGKGLFTQELEQALREGSIDLAVHSLKDLPIDDSPGLTIGAMPTRADARDALISRHKLRLADLPPNPRIGTSSLRRQAQILLARPDAQVVPLRGNVDTRLSKAMTEKYDAIVLALAGLDRLGLLDRATQVLDYEVMLPAPGQGALAVQCRADDNEILAILAEIHDPNTWAAVTAERAFLRELGGGCRAPVAAYAEVKGLNLWLKGLVAPADGSRAIRVAMKGLISDPEGLGEMLAEKALALGAGKILTSGR